MTTATQLLIAPCSLLLGALFQLLLARLLPARAKGIFAVLCCVLALLSVVATIPQVMGGHYIEARLGPWDGALALVLHVDALSILFAFMGTCIGGIVLIYSIGYMAEDKSTTRFYAIMMIFIGGFVSLVFSANLFLFYLCWEAVGLCSFGLVGFWYDNPEAVRGARKVLLMTHLAGYGLLASIIVIYHRTGSALWTDPAVAHAFTGGLFLLTLAAVLAKSVQFPLHTWIPEAMAAPTPVSALLHAACYVKAGVYLAARLYSFGPMPAHWGTIVVWIGTITMVVGVMYAMVQTDLKRMLAFHTVSQIGYMITGIGIGTPLAITAGLLHCLNHGFFKGGLFLSAGSVQHAAGTRDMNQLGGLAGKMPRTTWAWLISVGSMMGVPLMSGFASKWMLYTAALQAGWIVPALAAWVVSLGTVFSCVKATDSVFLGSTTPATEHAHESPFTVQLGLMLIAAGSVVLGVAPQLAVNYFLNPVLAALGMGSGVQVSWFGMTASAGSWFTTWGLVLAVVSLIFGTILFSLASSPRLATATAGGVLAGGTGGIFTGGEPFSGEGRLPAHDFSRLFAENWKTFFRWSNVDRYYLEAWRAMQAVSSALARLVSLLEKQALASVVIFSAAAFALALKLAAPVIGAEAVSSHRIPQPLVLAVLVAALALVLAAASLKQSRQLAPLMAFSGIFTALGLFIPVPITKLALLELGAFAALALVWTATKSISAKLTYAAVIVISAGTLIGSERMLAHGAFNMARALLITSIFVKLAVVPFFVWLLKLADELPSAVLGLIVAVVDIAAFAEFYSIAQSLPWMMTPHSLWLGAAAASALLSAILMLTQTELKRLLVLSTVEDTGFLLLGVAFAGEIGLAGALYGAIAHAIAKALLFLCLASPENEGQLSDASAGLTVRYPVSGFGFVFGMLAVLGVPPTMGFLGRWRLYSVAAQCGTGTLAIFAIASALSLIAYVLALTKFWWGPAPEDAAPGHESVAVKMVIVLLMVLLLAGGLWPNLLHATAGGM